jgi:UDP-N-acetylmuramoyl-tripeptide--D-alanyl-D-alanine ligase
MGSMERNRIRRRLAHALPELVWLNDGVREAVERSRFARLPLRGLARLHRRRLGGVLFVAVTGSSGKSTARELIAAVLRSRLSGTSTAGNANADVGMVRTLLRTSPRHDFSVLELGTGGPGMLGQLVDVAKPHIGVVTNVGLEHLQKFGSLEAIAAEKASLVQAIPSEGVAVLNADDPNVLAMGDACAGRVVTVGLQPGAALRAVDVDAAWPRRLSFKLQYDGIATPVRTSLCGRHWTHAVLAAVAVGLEAGIPLDDAVRAVETVQTARGRMQPIVDADGVTFIRDDVKHELLTALRALDFMADADASRKIVVIGRITNFEGDPHDVYARLAERALEVADEVIFTGPESRFVPAPRGGIDRLRVVPTVREATEYLRKATRPGDLVLLRSGNRSHLERIILARTREVECWLRWCGRRRPCESCELLDVPSEPDDLLPARILPARQQPIDTVLPP